MRRLASGTRHHDQMHGRLPGPSRTMPTRVPRRPDRGGPPARRILGAGRPADPTRDAAHRRCAGEPRQLAPGAPILSAVAGPARARGADDTCDAPPGERLGEDTRSLAMGHMLARRGEAGGRRNTAAPHQTRATDAMPVPAPPRGRHGAVHDPGLRGADVDAVRTSPRDRAGAVLPTAHGATTPTAARRIAALPRTPRRAITDPPRPQHRTPTPVRRCRGDRRGTVRGGQSRRAGSKRRVHPGRKRSRGRLAPARIWSPSSAMWPHRTEAVWAGGTPRRRTRAMAPARWVVRHEAMASTTGLGPQARSAGVSAVRSRSALRRSGETALAGPWRLAPRRGRRTSASAARAPSAGRPRRSSARRGQAPRAPCRAPPASGGWRTSRGSRRAARRRRRAPGRRGPPRRASARRACGDTRSRRRG